MRKLSSVARRGAAVTALAVGGSLAAVVPAQAAPTQCSYSASGRYATASCRAGTGQFRAVAYCRYQASNWTAYGPWVNTGGGASRATCSNGSAASAGIQTRN